MRLLLDTHALLWWLFDDPRLSQAARDSIAQPKNEIVVSSASGWEIATKHRIGKLPEAAEVVRSLPALLLKARFLELPISMEHAIAAGELPSPHRDPFDRMLAAQSQAAGLPVVTNDQVFGNFGCEVVW